MRGSRLLPRLSDQMLFQTRQATLWRAHQIMHWRVGCARLGEHFLGRHAAVHQPDPARLAVLTLDPLEKAPQRRLLYEVRTYTLRPGTLAEFEERFAKRLPLREKHSKLGAFLHTEFGPLNQAIHVYPYDDLRQRTSVRAAMAQDTALAHQGA